MAEAVHDDAIQQASLPRVRLVNATDMTGLRYLSADVRRLSMAAGCAAVAAPVSVGMVRPDDDPAVPFAAASFEAMLRASAHLDGGAYWVRSGFLPFADALAMFSEYLESAAPTAYFLDPELATRAGHERVTDQEVDLVRRRLLGRATVVVANAYEAAWLTGRATDSPSEMREACRALLDRGARAVVITGAHLEGFPRDVFHDGRGFVEIGADRIAFEGRLAGAGGVFSSAFLARLLSGEAPLDAAAGARREVSRAIAARIFWTPTGAYATRDIPREWHRRGLWIARPVGAEVDR